MLENFIKVIAEKGNWNLPEVGEKGLKSLIRELFQHSYLVDISYNVSSSDALFHGNSYLCPEEFGHFNYGNSPLIDTFQASRLCRNTMKDSKFNTYTNFALVYNYFYVMKDFNFETPNFWSYTQVKNGRLVDVLENEIRKKNYFIFAPHKDLLVKEDEETGSVYQRVDEFENVLMFFFRDVYPAVCKVNPKFNNIIGDVILGQMWKAIDNQHSQIENFYKAHFKRLGFKKNPFPLYKK
jgi:hypothetical protein